MCKIVSYDKSEVVPRYDIIFTIWWIMYINTQYFVIFTNLKVCKIFNRAHNQFSYIELSSKNIRVYLSVKI
jgi:hypothetical protein